MSLIPRLSLSHSLSRFNNKKAFLKKDWRVKGTEGRRCIIYKLKFKTCRSTLSSIKTQLDYRLFSNFFPFKSNSKSYLTNFIHFQSIIFFHIFFCFPRVCLFCSFFLNLSPTFFSFFEHFLNFLHTFLCFLYLYYFKETLFSGTDSYPAMPGMFSTHWFSFTKKTCESG